MAKRCLSCKREIAESQKICLVCGSSQNIIRHYSASGLFILLMALAAAAVSYWFILQANTEIESNLIKLEAAQTQIKQSETQANQALNQLKQMQLSAEQSQAEAVQSEADTSETEEKIAQAEKKASEAQKNVNWLAKQNKQLKVDLETLKNQLATAEQASAGPTEAQISQQIDLARQADQQTILSLNSEIAALKLQLQSLQSVDN